MGSSRLKNILIKEKQSSLQQVIRDRFSDAGVSFQYRTADPLLWKGGCEGLRYFPVDYSPAMIDYQIAYHARGESGLSCDLSVTLMHDNAACGIWPLFLIKDRLGNYQIYSNGQYILSPQFSKSMPRTLVRSMSGTCIEVAKTLMKQLNIDYIKSESSFRGFSELDDWNDKLLREGARTGVKHEMFLDLAPELSVIKSGFRKSYKSLINSGSKLWQVEVVTAANSVIWNQFKELHYTVAGKITRSNESWELQHLAIASGDAFFVGLRDDRGHLVGGGLFHVTRDEGYYAVGAYDRTLFDKPLGHVVQYYAIEEMKKRRIRWYKIGHRYYPEDMPKPTPKEINISDFKQGFCSHIFPGYIVTVNKL
jgi:FemAB family protein